MVIWKRPLTLAVATAGAWFFCGPSHVSAQALEKQDAPTVQGTFRQDSLPFATNYLPPAEPVTQPLPVANRPDDGEGKMPAEQDRHDASMPTVIVRPPAEMNQAINELTVDFERIVTERGDEFALKLIVPKSVRVIEVTPVAEPDSPRNFKIRVAQTGTEVLSENESPVRSMYSMPVAAPVHSASALNEVRQTDPAIQKQPIQVDAQRPRKSPARKGFKANPFYQSAPETDLITADATNLGDGQVVYTEEAIVDSGPQLASYSPASPLAPDTETTSLASEMYGPSAIEVGAEADFVIYVANRSAVESNEVNVSLDVPTGFDVVLLDREATIDNEVGRLTWNLKPLAPAEEYFIRYRVKAFQQGSQTQRVIVGLDEATQLECEFESSVMTECKNSSAPFLDYED